MADHLRVDREATDWLIRLQDDPENESLRANFDRWLSASATHAAAWAETERVSRAIAAVPAHLPRSDTASPAVSAVLPLSGARDRRRAGRQSWPILKLSAVAAAAACLAIVAGPNLLLQIRADAIADTGEIKTMHLADGSTVRLAPGGALAVRFADDQRQVWLLRGAAYFDVAHDPAHPFRVTTDSTTTTVLGTAFEVRRYDAGMGLTVKRGLVRVACDDGSASELLSAGQGLDLECGQRAERSTLEPARVAPWTNGQLVANDKPMREVIDRLRSWHRGLILARGAGIDRHRVTGVYNLRDPQDALEALAAAHDARVQRITPWITVISAD